MYSTPCDGFKISTILEGKEGGYSKICDNNEVFFVANDAQGLGNKSLDVHGEGGGGG